MSHKICESGRLVVCAREHPTHCSHTPGYTSFALRVHTWWRKVARPSCRDHLLLSSTTKIIRPTMNILKIDRAQACSDSRSKLVHCGGMVLAGYSACDKLYIVKVKWFFVAIYNAMRIHVLLCLLGLLKTSGGQLYCSGGTGSHHTISMIAHENTQLIWPAPQAPSNVLLPSTLLSCIAAFPTHPWPSHHITSICNNSA